MEHDFGWHTHTTLRGLKREKEGKKASSSSSSRRGRTLHTDPSFLSFFLFSGSSSFSLSLLALGSLFNGDQRTRREEGRRRRKRIKALAKSCGQSLVPGTCLKEKRGKRRERERERERMQNAAGGKKCWEGSKEGCSSQGDNRNGALEHAFTVQCTNLLGIQWA